MPASLAIGMIKPRNSAILEFADPRFAMSLLAKLMLIETVVDKSGAAPEKKYMRHK
jgi:hypothetical protein